MEVPASTAQQQQRAAEHRERLEQDDPRFAHAKRVGGGDKGREMVEHAAMGAVLDEEEERDALDWMLGDAPPINYDVTVQWETPQGRKPLTFVIRQMDGRKIDSIEQSHLNRQTGVLDKFASDAEIVAEATLFLTTPAGKQVDVRSATYRTVKIRDRETGEMREQELASTPAALLFRFRKQLGLLAGVANQVKRTAGWDPERVSDAQRRLVEASLG